MSKINEIKEQIEYHFGLASSFKEDMTRWGRDTEQYELSNKERYGAINYANGMKYCLEQLRPYVELGELHLELSSHYLVGRENLNFFEWSDKADELWNKQRKIINQIQEQSHDNR